jgi:hypothetical protein
MHWYEPPGFMSWRFFSTKRTASKFTIFIVFFVAAISVLALYVLELTDGEREGIKVIFFIASTFVAVVIYYWLNQYIHLNRVHVWVTDSGIVRWPLYSRGSRVCIAFSEIESFIFSEEQAGWFSFYVCHIKLKPMNSYHSDYFTFGIPYVFFRVNRRLIEKRLKSKPTAKELMSTY